MHQMPYVSQLLREQIKERFWLVRYDKLKMEKFKEALQNT